MDRVNDLSFCRSSPLIGFLRHSPPQATLKHFDKLCKWRSPVDAGNGRDFEEGSQELKGQVLRLPIGSPYVGSRRHAPPSPLLNFGFRQKCRPPRLPASFELPFESLELPCSALEVDDPSGFVLDDSPASSSHNALALTSLPRLAEAGSHQQSDEALGELPEEAWALALSYGIDSLTRIGTMACVARGFPALLKSEMVWLDRPVTIPPNILTGLAPQLGSWLPAWRCASKIVVPRSQQLILELSEHLPGVPLEVAWRFDQKLKGRGIEVVNNGSAVRRMENADEEFVVLGDAPLMQTVGSLVAPYIEVTLDDRSAASMDGGVNDFGIGVTAQPPSGMDELGSVADEVPLSWVVDFTKNMVALSVNNREAAKGRAICGDVLREGDRVGLLVTNAGALEIYLNGILREHLVPSSGDCVPKGVDLFPVLDLYGCTKQLSRTDADRPCA